MKTGQALYDNILMWADVRLGILKSKLMQPSTRNEFLESLSTIAGDVIQNNISPVVHIDCHGDRNGLVLPKGVHLEWDALYDGLLEINVPCRNNLFLVLAACEGAYLGQIMNLTKPAPCWGLVGPDRPVSFGDMATAFNRFYEEMFSSHDGVKAVMALNNAVPGSARYVFLNCFQLFEDGWATYERKFCMGKGRQQRVERLLTRFRSNIYAPLDTTRARKIVKKRLKEMREPAFKKYRRRFFMIDLYPENAARFPVSYHRVVQKANKVGA
jgi:hypothetical protein